MRRLPWSSTPLPLTLFLLFAAVALLAAAPVSATPLLSMQAAERCDSCHVMPDPKDPTWQEANYKLSQRKCGLTCGTCHVNPDGGMLRSTAGTYFGTKTLPLIPQISENIKKGLDAIKGNGFLTFGGDIRFTDIITNQAEKESPLFFPMQGDLYAGARLADHVSFLTQFGLERGGNAAVREAFAMVDNLPFRSYVKMGKFIPPYGHRLEDHTAFVRRELVVDQSMPQAYLPALEIGFDPLVFFARASYFNEDVLPRNNSDLTRHGWSASAGWHGLWLQLGGSYLNVENYAAETGAAVDRSAFGGFGAVRVWRLVWLFEADARQDEFEGYAGKDKTDAFITFNELNFQVVRGFTLKARYETFDPDVDVGDDRQVRYMGGLEFHPWPMVEVDFQYRYNDVPEENYYQAMGMVHLWF